MKTLYLDIFSGISGDMFVGALIDLGVDANRLAQEIARLPVSGYHLHITRGTKASIAGVKFDVHLDEDHKPAHEPAHSHEHSHEAHAHGPHGGPLAALSVGQVEISVFETGVP